MVQIISTVYPKKYAHGFCFAVLCCGYTLTDFPTSIRLTSLALWQSNDCPSASKATLMNMDKYFIWIHYERLHNHNKAKHNKTVCIFLGIYCKCHIIWWEEKGLGFQCGSYQTRWRLWSLECDLTQIELCFITRYFKLTRYSFHWRFFQSNTMPWNYHGALIQVTLQFVNLWSNVWYLSRQRTSQEANTGKHHYHKSWTTMEYRLYRTYNHLIYLQH